MNNNPGINCGLDNKLRIFYQKLHKISQQHIDMFIAKSKNNEQSIDEYLNNYEKIADIICGKKISHAERLTNIITRLALEESLYDGDYENRFDAVAKQVYMEEKPQNKPTKQSIEQIKQNIAERNKIFKNKNKKFHQSMEDRNKMLEEREKILHEKITKRRQMLDDGKKIYK
jgi:hypothetical protein